MNYTIYTVGNAEFMRAIFNGVAMITTSDSFPMLISIGMLFGVFYVCWECVFTGAQRFNLQHMMVAIIAYLCMFGPTKTVVIQDVYNTGSADVTVDKVPLGVAASASVVSRIGYKLCVLIETAYHPVHSVATVYQGGFAEPLRVINKIRRFDFSPKLYDAMNTRVGKYTPYGGSREVDSDIQTAVRNYIKNCTYEEIALGNTNPDKIKSASQSDNPLKSPNTALHVYLPINANSGNTDAQTFSCAAGYDVLDMWLNAAFLDDGVYNTLANSIGGAVRRDRDTGATGLDTIQGSLASIGQLGLDAQKLVKNQIIDGAFQAAALGYFQSKQDITTGIAVTQAIEQRNLQWAAEGTMFTKAVHALMTFVEGFCYAIMPIMAFVFVMGAMGMRVVGKYFQIIMWVQLWYPIMAIVNLYVINSAKSAIAPYATSTSLYDVNAIFHEVETHLGVAGMMLGATPLLALLIISGSSMAFTAIAGRMGGQDHFNEKAIRPDAIAPAPLMQMNPAAQTTLYQGSVVSGADSITPRLNYQDFQAKSTQFAATRATETMNSAATSLSAAFSNSATHGVATSIAQSAGSSIAATDSSSVQAIDSMARKLGYSTSADGSISAEQRGQFMADWQAGLKFAGLGAGTSGSWTDANGVSHSWKSSETIGKDEAAQFNSAHGSAMNRAMTTAFSKALNSTDSSVQNAVRGTTFGKNIAESVRASQTLSQAETALKNVGTGRTTALDSIASSINSKAQTGDTTARSMLDGAYHSLMSNLSGTTLENFKHDIEAQARTHGGDLLMGQQIATLEYLSHSENGRMGDFADIVNKGIGTNFVADNGIKSEASMPTPQGLTNFAPVGYNGNPNVARTVQNNIGATGKEVTHASGGAQGIFTTTGASPDSHYQESSDTTHKVDAANQTVKKEEHFQEVEKGLLSPNVVFKDTSTAKNGAAPIGSNEFDALAARNFAGLTETQLRYLKSNRTFASMDMIDPEGDHQTTRDVFQPEKAQTALYNDVENQYRARYGSAYDEATFKQRVSDSYTGIKKILDSADIQTPESLKQVTDFNRTIKDK